MSNEFNNNPQNEAEKLIFGLLGTLEREVDPQITRLHLENRLRRNDVPRRRPLRLGFRLAALATALVIIGAWSSGLELTPYDDAQQISMLLPADFVPANYPHVLGIFSKYATELADVGGHSLVVDYEQNTEGRYVLELGIIGVDYGIANDWIRRVMEREVWLTGSPYSIDQPLVPYRVKVRDMLAYQMGDHSVIERNVVRAWQEMQGQDRSVIEPSDITLIGREKDYMRKVSMVGK